MNIAKKKNPIACFGQDLWKNKVLWLMILPTLLYFIIFHYLSMPGSYIAFTQFNQSKGIFGSDFVGFKNFEFLIRSGDLWRITRNTLLYNIVFIVLGNIIQLIFAIMLSEIQKKWFKKVSQSIILLPYFISMVIVGAFTYNFFNYDSGFFNTLFVNMGLEKFDFYSSPGVWKYIVVFFRIWSGTGYGMIVYLSAITGIDSTVYEAAYIDGATVWQRIRFVTLPLLKHTFVLLLLFSLGGILKGSMDLFYNIIGDNSLLFAQTDIIDTYVYRSLRGTFNFTQSAAAGLYQSVLGFILVMIVNTIVKRLSPEDALF